jgi:LysR family glycine cleavage system transcriptional activator
MRRLPPFPELVAFEAVARHLSFTKAAAELAVTQSAVSHRVRRLEKYFGTQLLRRLNPGIVLTDAGAALVPELAATLNVLARLGKRRERRLRVAAASALCTWWLAGRLTKFMTRWPGVSVELLPIDNYDSVIPEVDIRILWVGPDKDEPSATQVPLFSEHVFPVCSPRLLPHQRPLRERGALNSLTLLHKATQTHGEWSWSFWLDRLGVDDKRKRSSELRFADLGSMLSAAADGSGVTLARSLMAHDALRDGRLIVPIAGVEPMLSDKKHVARWRRDRANDPDIKAFVSWLVAEAAATVEGTNGLIDSRAFADSKRARPGVVAVS